MTIKHIWSVLCKESITNQDDNLISLIGVLEELNSKLPPLGDNLKKDTKLAIPFNFELVNYWTKDLEKEVIINIKVEIIDPNSQKLTETTNSALFPKNNKRLRTRLKIQGLPVTVNGRYTFKISCAEGNESKLLVVAEIPLDVKFEITNPQKTPST